MVAASAAGPASRPEQTLGAKSYEWAVAIPVIVWAAMMAVKRPDTFSSPMLLMWALPIGLVDLMPVPAQIDLKFSLSFPLQLAVALIYPMHVAAAVAFVGTSDAREYRREVSVGKALFNRAQIAASVAITWASSASSS